MTHSRLDEAVVDKVAALLYRRVGLRSEQTLRGRLRRCIRDEAVAHGQDLETYFDTLEQYDATFQSLLNRVTVQETSFFRHPEHFEVLRRIVLPALRQPITIWSAGCANGQEAFSLAMIAEELGVDARVIASDVSTRALERTAAAHYSNRELAGLSPARVARHLTRARAGWEINQSLRDRVSTLHHNLVQPIPESVRSCHVIFCRNVLIYLAPDHARTFLDRLAETLPSDGYLFLGSAETLWPISDRFDAVRFDDTFIYRPRPEPVPATAPALIRLSAQQARPDRARRAKWAGVPAPMPALTTPPRSTPLPAVVSPPKHDSASSAAQLAREGGDAMAAGDQRAAVVAFRKWTYVAPDDAMAHIHLGLALEAAGDHIAAQRAYRSGRQALLCTPHSSLEQALEGYSKDELLRLVETRQQVPIS